MAIALNKIIQDASELIARETADYLKNMNGTVHVCKHLRSPGS